MPSASSPARYILLLPPVLSIVLAVWLLGLLSARVSAGGYDFETFLGGLALFLSLVLLGMSAYLAWCAFTISYTIGARTLTLRCGGVKQIIPLNSITAVHPPGWTVGSRSITVRWRGLADIVPGYLVGVGTSPQLGRVISVATRPAAGQLFVVTPGLAYGLSPARPSDFIGQLNRARDRAEFEPEQESPLTARTELHGISAWGAPLWADRTARRLTLAGLFLCMLLFAYMSLVFNGLPASLPLHWNAQAQVDVIGDPQELLRLPAFVLAIWLVNVVVGAWALSRERAATLFLLSGAIAAQVVFAAGALSIVLRTQ